MEEFDITVEIGSAQMDVAVGMHSGEFDLDIVMEQEFTINAPYDLEYGGESFFS
jgi:hypothetical protein